MSQPACSDCCALSTIGGPLMPNLSLPLYEPQTQALDHSLEVDRSKPYPSCEWLEAGIAFNRRSLCCMSDQPSRQRFPHVDGVQRRPNRSGRAAGGPGAGHSRKSDRRARSMPGMPSPEGEEMACAAPFDSVDGNRPVRPLQYPMHLLLSPDEGPIGLRSGV